MRLVSQARRAAGGCANRRMLLGAGGESGWEGELRLWSKRRRGRVRKTAEICRGLCPFALEIGENGRWEESAGGWC